MAPSLIVVPSAVKNSYFYAASVGSSRGIYVSTWISGHVIVTQQYCSWMRLPPLMAIRGRALWFFSFFSSSPSFNLIIIIIDCFLKLCKFFCFEWMIIGINVTLAWN